MKEKVWAYIIGTGLVLFVIHNPLQPAKEYTFLPVIGLTLSVLGVCIVLQDHRKEITLGSRYIYIPLAVIALSIAGSGLIKLAYIPEGEAQHIMGFALACTMFGFYLFGVYLTGRVLGKKLFTPFTWAVVIGAVSCLGYGIAFPGVKTGGLISPTNYDIATGLLVFGTLVSLVQRQWWLVAIALVGLFFTGAEEAIFACVVVLAVVLVRRDWSRKMLLPAGALVITLAVCTPLGITQQLYFPTAQKVAAVKEVVEDTEVGRIASTIIPNFITDKVEGYKPEVASDGSVAEADLWLDKATNTRWLTGWRLPKVKPLGYGYNISSFYFETIHNVPLIIVHQIGVVGAVAWTFATLYLLIKTKWKYAWIGVLSLCVFDHFIWTQAAPFWWSLVGVSSASNIKTDLIFRKGKV